MNLLIVGGGKAGAWQMRGVQVGTALGARVCTNPTEADVRWADLVLLVKKSAPVWAPLVHQVGKPIVWDALDCWRQPADHGVTEAQAIALLHNQIRALKPILTIGATEAMAKACDGVYLPHHSWAGLTPTPARERVTTVGYEGNPLYLGRWRVALEQQCTARGWTFVVNPPDLRAMDLLVALREGAWDGWICRAWKSGVKLVNAIAAGRPVITQPGAAVAELWPAGSVIESVEELSSAFDAWTGVERRHAVVEASLQRAPQYTLASVAARYGQILAFTGASCAA